MFYGIHEVDLCLYHKKEANQHFKMTAFMDF